MSELAQAREAKISQARTLANWAIETEYQSYKQLNISRMSRRIDAVRAQCDGYEAAAAEDS